MGVKNEQKYTGDMALGIRTHDPLVLWSTLLTAEPYWLGL